MSYQEKLSPPLLEAPLVPTIDSLTFLNYLFQDHPQSRHFSPRLDLSWLTPSLDYLYQQKTATDLYLGEERKFMKKFVPDKAKRQVPSERETVLFYDPDTDDYQITPASHGSVYSVQSTIAEIGQSGKIPLIDIHTHPLDSLPSPKDYQLLVLRPLEAMPRFINAIIVLCPQIQILALATPQTPSLGAEVLSSFLNQFQAEIKTNPQIATLQQEEETVITNHFNRARNLLAQLDELLAQAANISGEIPPETLQGLKLASEQKIDSLIGEFKNNFTRPHLKLSDYSEKNLNATLFQIARLWHIQFYTSTDKSNFVKTSA